MRGFHVTALVGLLVVLIAALAITDFQNVATNDFETAHLEAN